MSDTFSGKTVVITGSTRGIGREMARQFAQAGASIVIHGTNSNRAAEVMEELTHSGTKAVACLGDVADPAFANELAECAMEHFGRLDIFIANAGMVSFEPFLEMTSDVFRRFMDVHVTGAFQTSQAAAKHMINGGSGGRILYMASVAGINGMFGYAAYCAAKSAVMSLARVAAIELAPHKITVNALAPGPVQNEMMDQLWGPEKLKERCLTIPSGRLAQPEEVAKLALFLASPDAAYITGQTMFLDGGATAAGLYTHEVFKRAAANPAS